MVAFKQHVEQLTRSSASATCTNNSNYPLLMRICPPRLNCNYRACPAVEHVGGERDLRHISRGTPSHNAAKLGNIEVEVQECRIRGRSKVIHNLSCQSNTL